MVDKARMLEADEKKSNQKEPQGQDHSLKGTFFFVMSLGVFLIISWAAVFVLFITR